MKESWEFNKKNIRKTVGANQDIRDALYKSGVKQWELADKAGLSPNYFVIKLRHELPSEEKFKLFTLIQEIVDEREVRS